VHVFEARVAVVHIVGVEGAPGIGAEADLELEHLSKTGVAPEVEALLV